MSLRLRLFLLFGGLVAVLIAAQAWWFRTLSRDLSSELSVIAVQVGNSVARILVAPTEDGEEAPPGEHDHGVQIIAEDETILSSKDDGTPGEQRVRRIIKRFSAHPPESEAHEHETTHETTHEEKVLIYRLRGNLDEVDVDVDHHRLVHLDPTSEDLSLAFSGQHHERIPIPRQGFTERLDDFSRRLVFGSLALLLFGLLVAAVVAHRVASPMQRLAEAARQVGGGALGTRLDIATDGEVGEAIVAFNRMSEQLAVHDQQKRRQSAERHLAELGEIARGLAHSLRNPLNALGLSLEELADQRPDDDRDHKVELATAARRQIQHIDRTLRSFLALSSDHGGTLVAPVDLAGLAHDVALEALQDGRGEVRLEVEAAEDLPALPGIEAEVRAVLQALVINAVEASPADGLVEIRLTSSGEERCRVEIADRGAGLSDEVRQRLFTPHATTKAHGSGMGLFLAHRIATSRYGGELELIDRDGGGTLAVLELGPRQQELDDEGEGDG